MKNRILIVLLIGYALVTCFLAYFFSATSGKSILAGFRDPGTWLWFLPISVRRSFYSGPKIASPTDYGTLTNADGLPAGSMSLA